MLKQSKGKKEREEEKRVKEKIVYFNNTESHLIYLLYRICKLYIIITKFSCSVMIQRQVAITILP